MPNWEECEAPAKTTVNSFDWSHSSAGIDCKQNLCAISNNQPQSPEFSISTKMLRNWLQEESLSDEAIRDCEAIMKSELSVLQQQLRLLQQKNISLTEAIRRLEEEKMELETKVVDETENHMEGGHFSSESVHED